MQRLLILVLSLLLGVACPGCSRSTKLDRVVPVEVKVTHKGQPVANSQVVLHPVAPKEDLLIVRPNGFANENGLLKLTTYHSQDGAPEGEYVVTVIWSLPTGEKDGDDEVRGPDRFQGRYADPKVSPLRVTVARNGPQPLVLELP